MHLRNDPVPGRTDHIFHFHGLQYQQRLTLTDLATFLTVGKRRGLKALYAREDPLLLNQYAFHLVPGSPGEGEAQRLRAFLASEEAARIVAGLRVEGTPLFAPLRGRCAFPLRP